MRQGLRAHVNGVQLNYEVEGNGPPLVLLHGLGGSLRVWDDLVPLLAAHRTVLRLDLRGFGLSEKTAEAVSLDQHARDVAELLAWLSIASAAIVGHSMGGSVALEFGLDFPDRASALVVVAGTAQLTPQGIALFRERAQVAAGQGVQPLAEVARLTSLPPTALRRRPELGERYAQMLLANRAEDYVRGCQTLMRLDLTERVRNLAKPTLVLVGELDQVCPPESSLFIAEQVVGAQLELLPEIGHMVPWEAPQILAERTLAFLATHGG